MAVGLLSIAAPYVLDSYWVRVLTTVWLFAVLASAINLIAGYTGYAAFGNVVFFGLGAYSTAIGMTRLHLPFWAGMALGVVVCGTYAIIIGWPLLRLRGHYFAIATLGMNEATRAIVDNLSGLTGGGMGLSVPTRAGEVVAINQYFYFLMLSILLTVMGIAYSMGRSRFGYGCRAIRFDEEAAASTGVPTTRYKIMAWVLSASITGMAGGVYAHWFAFIEPAVVFDMSIAVKMFVMMMLGGGATVFGPVVGAVLVEMIGHVAWSQFLTYHSAVFAFIIIGVVIFIPGGLMNIGLPHSGASRAVGVPPPGPKEKEGQWQPS
jgi:branched-chain amino acid transport system permease protein